MNTKQHDDHQLFKKVLVVMPALNEEQVIGKVLAELYETLPAINCLVVDDGSNDSTAEIAQKAGAKVIRLPYNLGVGGAMRVGFNYAIEENFTSVVQLDADGQHDPRDIPKLIEELNSSDLVLGARFAGEGTYSVKGPRKWAMVLLANILSKSAKVKLTDTTSGFRASGPRSIKLFAKHYPAEYLGDTVESLVIAARAGLKIIQVPVSMRERAGGSPSHSPVKASLFLFRVGLAMFFAFLRPPIQIIEER